MAYGYRCFTFGIAVSCVKTAELIEMLHLRGREGLTHVGPRNHVLDGGPDTPTGRGTLEEDMHRPIVTYLRRRMCLPSARSRQMHSSAVRSDKTAVRHIVRLLDTCYIIL